MEEYLNSFLGSEMPLAAAFVMGLLVSLSPCTLAANVAVLSYISKQNVRSKSSAIVSGSVFIIGKMIAYIILGYLLCLFLGGLKLGSLVQNYFGYIVGPVFVIVGFLMLDIIHIHGLADRCSTVVSSYGKRYALGGSFLLGFILAFAFCPYCGAIYFGGVIPLAVSTTYSLGVLLVFSLGSALPLLILSLLFTFVMTSLDFHSGWLKYGVWLRRILAILFVITGVLFIFEYYLE